ncbi:MAG: dienelactone hydrolase family protein [Longimonas sp.]|uniref:alpha/beta hydrolase n=1 Tax=Longimonas sp. TaxID=2039626 RepID=UPI003361B3CA
MSTLSSLDRHHGNDPHGETQVVLAGANLDAAHAAVVFIHGRGATAESILRLIAPLAPESVALIAPQARGRTWYPNSFLAALEDNEPGLSSGLRRIGSLLDTLNATYSIPTDRIMIGGFSQGACLSTEYAARFPTRYGGIIGLSGGLIGNGMIPNEDPPNDKQFNYDGDFEETPVFLGCSDRDPHIPQKRVDDTAAVFRNLNASVDKRIYEGMGHIVNDDERKSVQELLARLAEPA